MKNTNDIYEIRKIFNGIDECYQNLANAIIAKAADDYISAYLYISKNICRYPDKNPRILVKYKRQKDYGEMTALRVRDFLDCLRFFNSEEFELYSPLSPERDLVSMLDRLCEDYIESGSYDSGKLLRSLKRAENGNRGDTALFRV